MDKDINKVLEAFSKKFPYPGMILEDDGRHYSFSDIESFLRQALEAEKAKREAMAREMIGDIDNYSDNLINKLIDIALKYGVEV